MSKMIQTAPETQVWKVAKLDASAWFVTGMFSHVMLSKKASQRAMSHLDTSSILYWLDIRIKFSESSLQSMLSIVREEEEDEEEEEKEQEVSCWVQRRIQGAGERRGKERRCGTFPQYHKTFPIVVGEEHDVPGVRKDAPQVAQQERGEEKMECCQPEHLAHRPLPVTDPAELYKAPP